MTAKLRTRWWQIKQHPFIAIGVIVVLIALIVFIFAVQTLGWDWTGFTGGESKVTTTMITPGTTVATEKQPTKTLWDWLGLLAVLAIPIVVGFGAAWYTAQQGKFSDRENKDNQREAALQTYIDKMSELLLDKDNPLREPIPGHELGVKMSARARTLTVLPHLDPLRKRTVLQFLHESNLISKNLGTVILSGADLSGADLSASILTGKKKETELYEYGAQVGISTPIFSITAKQDVFVLKALEMSGADLREDNLAGVNLREADLKGTRLTGADLHGAYLKWADLSYAILEETDLSGADLSGVDLSRANLRGTNLSGANLTKARVSDEQLDKAKSLQGTIMPDGSIHS